ncbi:MAG: NAD(P)/FAD-dependent oxidoreductase [Candidatus Omnitrophota bacterium]
MSRKIIVVGGGPAGMIAAIRAGQLGQDVTLIEKNSGHGKKLLLSGKGRCNLTNNIELDTFIRRFFHGGEFLRDAFAKFFNQDLIRFFEQRGLKLKTERQARVFPVSDRACSILKILDAELGRNKVNSIYNSSLREIIVRDNTIEGVKLSGDAKIIPADKLILCTGGVSYGFTGSTGDGIRFAGELGHRITPLKPSLVALEIRGKYPKLLEGLSLKNLRLKFSSVKKQVVSEVGELLWTDSGISGPLVLSLSGKIVDWREKYEVSVDIDLKPALTHTQLDQRLLREFKLFPKINIRNLLKNLLPLRLVDVFVEIAKINPGERTSQITHEERQRIVYLLKGLRFEIAKSLPIEQAMVTSGGVCLRDINPRTMESRLVKGLYFAGEMIDVDADTGGFNLQAAFSTGYLAGESAALN